jgi:hypothetical protein
MELSLEKRYEIAFLHEHPVGPKWGYRKIAKRVRCSITAARYWVERYRENRDLSTAERTSMRGKFMFGGVFLLRVLASWYALRGTWMLILCVLFISRDFWLPPQSFLARVTWTGFCKRIMIPNTVPKMEGGK